MKPFISSVTGQHEVLHLEIKGPAGAGKKTLAATLAKLLSATEHAVTIVCDDAVLDARSLRHPDDPFFCALDQWTLVIDVRQASAWATCECGEIFPAAWSRVDDEGCTLCPNCYVVLLEEKIAELKDPATGAGTVVNAQEMFDEVHCATDIPALEGLGIGSLVANYAIQRIQAAFAGRVVGADMPQALDNAGYRAEMTARLAAGGGLVNEAASSAGRAGDAARRERGDDHGV